MSRTLFEYRRLFSFSWILDRSVVALKVLIRFSIRVKDSHIKECMPIDGAPRTQARGYPISHLELCKIICLTVRRRCLGGLAQSQHRRTRDLQGRKFAFPLFLGLVVDFLPFCTAGCTHSCLKSRYFLPFLTSHKNRLVRPVIACKTMSFSPHNRL